MDQTEAKMKLDEQLEFSNKDMHELIEAAEQRMKLFSFKTAIPSKIHGLHH